MHLVVATGSFSAIGMNKWRQMTDGKEEGWACLRSSLSEEYVSLGCLLEQPVVLAGQSPAASLLWSPSALCCCPISPLQPVLFSVRPGWRSLVPHRCQPSEPATSPPGVCDQTASVSCHLPLFLCQGLLFLMFLVSEIYRVTILQGKWEFLPPQPNTTLERGTFPPTAIHRMFAFDFLAHLSFKTF